MKCCRCTLINEIFCLRLSLSIVFCALYDIDRFVQYSPARILFGVNAIFYFPCVKQTNKEHIPTEIVFFLYNSLIVLIHIEDVPIIRVYHL